jgi:hypothetical protein
MGYAVEEIVTCVVGREGIPSDIWSTSASTNAILHDFDVADTELLEVLVDAAQRLKTNSDMPYCATTTAKANIADVPVVLDHDVFEST